MAKRYYIEGTLEKGQLKLSKNSLQALDTCSCLPHIRFTLKERIRKWCHQMEDKKVGHYFASMLTGDIDDRLLAMEFRKWGLSHVLAISGFHFALIALGFGILIQLVLPSRFTEISLMVVLSIAFLYFGPSASISRAYIMITLYLLGRKLLRTMDSLNFLGVALLIELLFHPNHAAEIGFQLSYGATFGILAFYAPMEQVMQRLFPKRSRETLKNFTFLDKHGYLATSFLRKGLALSLAVHLMTLPILLYHFGNFPMLSPLFNLFIPPLLSLTILGIPLGSINSAFTRLILSFCSHTPEKFNLQWHTPIFPFELVISLITLIGTLGLTLTRRMRQNSVLSTYGGRSSVG